MLNGTHNGVEQQLNTQLMLFTLSEAGADPAALRWVRIVFSAVISWRVSLPVNSVPAAVTTLTGLELS